MQANRATRIDIRTTESAKNAIENAAHHVGITVSAFILESAMEKATKILREAQIIKLSIAEHDRFISALENPPKPSKKLIQLITKHHKQGK